MGSGFGKAVLIVASLFALYTAWTSGTNPAAFASRLGLSIANPGGLNEIRAQYAGVFLAVALLCAAAAAGFLDRRIAFFSLIVVFGGLFAGRLGSLLLNGGVAGYGPTIRALYWIDGLGTVLAVTALIMGRPGPQID